MKNERLIKAIEIDIQKKRTGQYLFDDDETAEDIIKHFKTKRYKVYKATSYGLIVITKRWWQK